ncbi:TetR/AcrR family transcriptional regulator [Treponema brennaborense]|uniref:Regulatory protein TetR n=1 Tax=Treponema brennaborense (strain DSM 12168 / CIP 105900 / DD5/3) TaxID=906968 RepID=F4LMV4_TREBD|nr:TetR/AcrR family transcriptional regulator [Treponema brennaborense]AEE17844.1 regulatory protein TetR [Treponema brennaborense DSM 12168]
MAIVVEHEKRKREILDKSLDIFMEEGYEDVTFQKIADRCGITRTTLYIYFKNKREIFLWSIKQLTGEIETSLLLIVRDADIPIKQRLSTVLNTILDKCAENRRLFTVTLSYLLQLKKSGKDPGVRVRRRILRLRHLLSTIVIEGINSGDFKEMNVRDANEMLYGIIESAIFRLAVLDQQNVDELRGAFDLAIQGISAR